MDLIIKNLERLKDYSNGNHKPIERVVVDFDKLATEDFTQLFFDACEKYKEPEKYCRNCEYFEMKDDEEPCKSCYELPGNRPNWKAKTKESEHDCPTCKYNKTYVTDEPCYSCCDSIDNDHYEPAEPTKMDLKEVTERMQSEFDATGKDVKIFMNERVIKR